MTTLNVSNDLKLPREAVTETFAILGRRGSGKTHTAIVMAEEMLTAGIPVVVIDPLDVWFGLRVSKDGKKAGFPIYVCGGAHQDIPLTPDAGRVLADAVVDRGLPMVLSLRHLSKSDQRRFVGEFCERLYDRKADPKHRTALHVFIDEADAFVPQRLMPGAERCFGAVDTMVRRGRSSGLAVTLISQRPQVINKDVLSQTEVLVSHQLTGPQDRKALEAWIEANDTENRRAEFMGSLASLARGRAWFWSPGLLSVFKPVQVRDRKTFDSSATPKAGVTAVASPKAFAEVDIEKLTAEIAATIEKAKADDPRELRKQIAELRKQLSTGVHNMQPERQPAKIVEKFILKDGQLARLEKAGESIGDLSNRLFDLTEKVQALWKDIKAAVDQTRQPITPTTTATTEQRPSPHVRRVGPALPQPTGSRPARVVSPSSNGNGSDPLPKVERVFLSVLAQRDGKGTARNQLAVFAGYSSKSRHVDNTISSLRTKGYLDGGREALRATPSGIAALGEYEPLPTGEALRAYWVANAGGAAEAAMLSALVGIYPDSMTRDELATASNYSVTSRHVDNTISRLRTLELVAGDRSALKASDELFD